jgi:membrane fusion protein (multidrug efflux system)
VVLTLVVIGAGLYALYYWLVLAGYESTDNAYVQGDLVQITPQLPGTVTAISASETDRVKAGDVLVRFDQADAQLAPSRRNPSSRRRSVVRILYEQHDADRSDRAARAELAQTRSDFQQAQDAPTGGHHW